MSEPWRDHHIPKGPCPFCGFLLTGASEPGGSAPTPGMARICVECGELFVFGADLRPRVMTPEELLDYQTSEAWPLIERMRRRAWRLSVGRGTAAPPKRPRAW